MDHLAEFLAKFDLIPFDLYFAAMLIQFVHEIEP